MQLHYWASALLHRRDHAHQDSILSPLPMSNPLTMLHSCSSSLTQARTSTASTWRFKNLRFSGYGHTILARWEGVTDSKREQQLFKKADLKCNVKEETGNLVIIELLSTNDCRFFPILTEEDDNTIARFTVDFSACEDTKEPLILKSDATPQGCSFSYTGGVEGTVAWTIDAPIVLKLDKIDGIIKKAVDTGISTINTDQPADNRIFDLQGRELNCVPESGIYIQNGKKYVK